MGLAKLFFACDKVFFGFQVKIFHLLEEPEVTETETSRNGSKYRKLPFLIYKNHCTQRT